MLKNILYPVEIDHSCGINPSLSRHIRNHLKMVISCYIVNTPQRPWLSRRYAHIRDRRMGVLNTYTFYIRGMMCLINIIPVTMPWYMIYLNTHTHIQIYIYNISIMFLSYLYGSPWKKCILLLHSSSRQPWLETSQGDLHLLQSIAMLRHLHRSVTSHDSWHEVTTTCNNMWKLVQHIFQDTESSFPPEIHSLLLKSQHVECV